MKYIILCATATLLCASALANSVSEYAGQQRHAIKALSDEKIAAYLNAKGMGYAKAAELNHYPGPKHVLELATKLKLSEEQGKLTQKLFDEMKVEAKRLGKQLVEKERELDQHFANGSIDQRSLKTLLAEIGVIETGIRHTHLSAHLKQATLLTKHQVNLYDQLRGYTSNHGKTQHHHH